MDAFTFDRTWRVDAPPSLVYAALADVDRYAVWWPQVRSVRRVDAHSGRAVIRSVLPYQLHLLLRRELEDPVRRVLRVDVRGDLHGWCAFEVAADGSGTVARFTQAVRLDNRRLQRLPAALRPVLVANHEWMMRGGERGLRRHLRRDAPQS